MSILVSFIQIRLFIIIKIVGVTYITFTSLHYVFPSQIRARYYVLSTLNPSVELFNTLLAAKKLWPENTEVSIDRVVKRRGFIYKYF